MESDDLHDHLPYSYKEDLMSRFGSGEDLGILQNGEIFAREPLFMAEDDTSTSLDGTKDSEDPDDIIILHIDIREPIRKLRTLLEQKIGVDLSRYEFWLQDAQTLEPHKNLVDQCVKGEGLVQINIQVRAECRRINIVDVLKPTDEALAELSHLSNDQQNPKIHPEEMLMKQEHPIEIQDAANTQHPVDPVELLELTTPHEPSDTIDISDKVTTELIEDGDANAKKEATKWVIDTNFKKDLARLRISDDPKEWTLAQVRHWLQWAVRQFNLSQIKLQDWSITGKELSNLSIEEFRQKVPHDPEDLFWTHFELLRKCKMVAVRGQISDDEESEDHVLLKKSPKIGPKPVKFIKSTHPVSQLEVVSTPQGNRTGNNGQIQLWQFLLEILTDREHVDIIQWVGGQGEFKLNNPERVAQLWGIRKNKLTMNYEKLSRALRYYYDGDMISKVHNKRFVYKFVCDLTQLIGYSAQELSNLVNQANPDASTMYNEIL